MMGMKAFKLNDSIERKELSLDSYSQELDDIAKRYVCCIIVQQGKSKEKGIAIGPFGTINNELKDINVMILYLLRSHLSLFTEYVDTGRSRSY